jgi:hypothetical protein
MDEGVVEFQYKPGQELVIRVRPFRLSLGKNETLNHLLAANREVLMAFRSVLDAAIKVSEPPQQKDRPQRKKIPVE